MGWKQSQSVGSCADELVHIGDEVELATEPCGDGIVGNKLVTVCAASANSHEAKMRLARHPSAIAEDMEGFGVAMACKLAGVPVQIVRGISNQVGDRDKRNWNIPAALEAASELVITLIS